MKALWILLIFAAGCVGESLSSFPALYFSEQLIPGLMQKFHEKDNVYSKQEFLSQLDYSVKECIPDAFFLINQPGLRLEDFQNFTNFGYLRAYMGKSSTLQAIPRVLTSEDQGLDFDALNEHIEFHCHAQTHRVVTDNPEEVPHYIDVKKRVIRINFSPLPEEKEERDEALKKHDTAFHEIARRLPTPHHFVLYTSNSLNSISEKNIQQANILDDFSENIMSLEQLTTSQTLQLFDNSIFPDITIFDGTRKQEFERNKNIRQATGRAEFPKPRLTNENLKPKDLGKYDNDINDSPAIFDSDLISENEGFIAVIFSVVILFILYKFLQTVIFGLKIIFTAGKTKSE